MRGSEWQTWAVKGLDMMNRRAWVRTGAAWAAVACMASTPLLASAADMAPDAMIKQLSEEVLNTLKTDQAIRAGETKYTAVSGTAALKAAIMRKFERENGLRYAPSQIIATAR